ncbi:hypothetical protein cce_5030 [Crocosphaera subtropica ATCC 51142]|uniref:Uncharacterized protein n=1 Tax=Crocosphaera subtropica (strain ATCC 51142 / BH68) TaxID=43989 RepID=B1X2L5_CROS5|nr:hypothetical protein cce_5030 [Crocosphaera subtropica ATCC 51142]
MQRKGIPNMDKDGKETPNYVKLVTKSKKSWVVK